MFGSERLTGALLDRLTHHVHILEMNGESYRLNQSKGRARKGSNLTLRNRTPKARRPPTSGALLAQLMYFCSGQPMQNLSGVDTKRAC